jgi:hypothetical protein
MKKIIKNLFSKFSFRMFKEEKKEVLRKIEIPKEFWY